jgi:hypothetical protein
MSCLYDYHGLVSKVEDMKTPLNSLAKAVLGFLMLYLFVIAIGLAVSALLGFK